MAREQPLASTIVATWLAAWEQRDPFCDDAVRHLQGLIPDDHCFVLVTLGVGTRPRSLLFRRWRHVVPVKDDLSLRRREHPLDYGRYDLLVGPDPPVAPRAGQLWHQTGAKVQKIFTWDGADWALYGAVRDDLIISKQGRQECGFMQARADAHDLAQWIKGAEVIYTFDGSTWGSA